MWFGYAREDLLAEHGNDTIHREIYDYAASLGLGTGRVYLERIAPERVLHSMLQGIDCDLPSEGDITLRFYPSAVERLEQVTFSWRWRLDLNITSDLVAPRTSKLWQLIEMLEGQGGGHVIVPSRAHLTSLGPAGRTILQRFILMPTVHLYCMDAMQLSGAEQTSAATPNPSGHIGRMLLMESRVDEIEALTKLEMTGELTRLFWIEAIELVDRACRKLLEYANSSVTGEEVYGSSSRENSAVIRLLCLDDQLTVELEEPRIRSDQLPDDLAALCECMVRVSAHGRTVTRCVLSRQRKGPSGPIYGGYPGA